MFKASGQAQFDKLLEKATSNFLLEPEWGSIMMICDLIRQKDCPPKYAVAAIKKKLHHQNPHVAMFGLQVLESIVKNCGSPVHDEVATKQFMEELREVSKTTHHENVKDKILELILTWAHAFRKIPTYRAIQDVLNIMKAEGAAFKPLVETDAMFVADTAPEWADGECCHRCRVEFGIVNRKHHCRACGQIFCHKCSSRMCTLPKFGIEKEVRVCESCFEKYGKPHQRNPDSHSNLKAKTVSSDQQILNEVLAASLAEAQARAQNPTAPKTKTEEELAEEEQLQLALAISQSEAEAKEIEKKRGGGGGVTYSAINTQTTMSATEDHSNPEKGSPVKSSEPDDPELARYLNRTYWETRSKDENSKEETGGGVVSALKGSADKTSNKSWNSANYAFMPSAPVKENKDKGEQAEEIDHFIDNLRGQIEMFANRMKSNASRRRPIANDSSVQALFGNISVLHSQLLNFIQDQDNARGNYEGLQDKLGQIRDARAALDDLRREHTDRLRIQAEEQERIKQFQMAQKLYIMRQKKQEYLQYQRQSAMQRMQEQEREMQMRIEQQKQQIGQIGLPQGQYYPQGPGYMPQGGPEMRYMPQHGYGGGQFIAPPNVTLGQQPPQQQMSQYIPQGPQFMPPGHQMPQMNQQQPPQQNVMQQQQQHMPQQQQNIPTYQQQQPPLPPQQQQQQEPGYPPQQQPGLPPQQHQQQPGLPPQPQQFVEQIPPLPHPEPSIAALISFDD